MSDKQFKEMMLLAGIKPINEVRAKSLNESVTIVFKRGSKRLMKESVQLNERNDVPSAFSARSKDRWTRGSTSIDQYNSTFVQEMKKLLDERPELAQGVNWKSESAVDALVRRLMNKYNIYEDVIFNGDDEANFMAAYKQHYGVDLVDGTQVGPWYEDLTRKMMSVGAGLRESAGRLVKESEQNGESFDRHYTDGIGDQIPGFQTQWETDTKVCGTVRDVAKVRQFVKSLGVTTGTYEEADIEDTYPSVLLTGTGKNGVKVSVVHDTTLITDEDLITDDVGKSEGMIENIHYYCMMQFEFPNGTV